MNTNKLFLFLLIPLILIMVNCSDEQCEPCIECEICDSISTNNDSTFMFGIITENIIVSDIDTFIQVKAEYHQWDEYLFDIDLDGQDDFKFISEDNDSPGGARSLKSRIEVLNTSIEVSIMKEVDTIYSCWVDSTEEYVHDYVHFNKISNYHCNEYAVLFNKVDTITTPLIYDSGNTIENVELWSSKDIVFSTSSRNYGVYEPTYIDQGAWNELNLRYMLFRYKKQEKYHYGWIKLNVENFKEIKLYEFAIQKFQLSNHNTKGGINSVGQFSPTKRYS